MRWRVGVLCLAGLAIAPVGVARAQGEAAAGELIWGIVTRSSCVLSPDRSSLRAVASDVHSVSRLRPAGYEVSVGGAQGGRYYWSSGTFVSRWLVIDGEPYPQNLDAALIRANCDYVAGEPRGQISRQGLTHLDPVTGEIAIGSEGWGVPAPSWAAPYYGRGRPTRESTAALWTHCASGAQTVRFKRTVHLLGPPGDLRVSIVPVFRGMRKWPVSRIQMYVNGARALNATRKGAFHSGFRSRGLGLIRFGPNTFEILVTKAKTGACNTVGGKRKFAVLLGLSGRQAWQLAISRPPPQEGIQFQGDVATVASVPYTVTNNGPSVLPAPVLIVEGSPNGRTAAFARFVVNGDSSICTTSHWLAVCGLDPIPPGQSRTVNIQAFGAPPADNQNRPFMARWQVSYSLGSATGSSPGSICFNKPPEEPDCSKYG